MFGVTSLSLIRGCTWLLNLQLRLSPRRHEQFKMGGFCKHVILGTATSDIIS